MTKRDQQHLGSAGKQVQSPGRHSGLRIHHCHSCGLGCKYSLYLIPGLGTQYAAGWPKEKKKNFKHRINKAIGMPPWCSKIIR